MRMPVSFTYCASSTSLKAIYLFARRSPAPLYSTVPRDPGRLALPSAVALLEAHTIVGTSCRSLARIYVSPRRATNHRMTAAFSGSTARQHNIRVGKRVQRCGGPACWPISPVELIKNCWWRNEYLAVENRMLRANEVPPFATPVANFMAVWR